MAEPWSTDIAEKITGSNSADQETVALLEEEIARLEYELRMRDEAAASERHACGGQRQQPAEDHEAQERMAQLGGELAAREETIALLLEQIRLADEAEAASHAEWEQLHHWVEEVERRIAGQGQPESEIREDLAAERRNSDLLRQAAEKDQRTWESQRQALVAEVERLRSRFTAVAGESDTTVAAVQVLEQENQQLRAAYDELARNMVASSEVEALAAELKRVRQQHAALAQTLDRERDEHQRQRNESEANLNAMRSQLARDSLRRKEEQIRSTGVVSATAEPALDPDMRIRALREHLKEIHQDETEQRMQRSLVARLSRLWNHTGANSR
jgi:hypothetical protein